MVRMHRVDQKKRRAATLRIVAYAITLTLSVITTIVLLYVALGYRIDRTSGQVVRSGLLLVNNQPEAAGIYIDDVLRDNATPGRFVLSAGEYSLRLERAGYRTWAKQIEIAASGVRKVDYPMLIPNELKPVQLAALPAPYLTSQSRDRKVLLLHTEGAQALTLVRLNDEKFEQSSVALSSAVAREGGAVGTFSVIEWARDNKHVLLRQTLPSGTQNLLSLDTTKPAELVNISALYGADVPHDVHYVGDDTNLLYGLHNGIVSRYDLRTSKTEALLQNVRSYRPYGGTMLLFDRQASGKQAEVGIWDDTRIRIVHKVDEGLPASLFAYARFDEHYYFVTASPEDKEVIIYRDPLDTPKKVTFTPFITLKFAQPQKIDFSDSAQFLLVQNGKNFITYDFDDFRQYTAAIDFELAANSAFEWIDAAHLGTVRSDGRGVILDYDGSNRQGLALTAAPQLYFSNNYRFLWRTKAAADGMISIDSVPLVTKADR